MPDNGKHKNRTLRKILMIAAILATAAGIWSTRMILDRAANLEELKATRFPVARELQPFELLNQNRQVFNNATLLGRWSFLFFGYTHCPDVCPTTLSVLNSVAHQLQDMDADIRFVFVSVDPERDTPEQLARFVSYFNENFIGVTGSTQNINNFTRDLGVMHVRAASAETSMDYLVDHTAAVFLIDPDGRYHAVFSPPLDAGTISDDFRIILNAW